MIILDTNILPRRGPLKNTRISALLKVASYHGLTVCIPEMVLHESLHARTDAIASAIQSVKDAVTSAEKLIELDPIYLPGIEEATQRWKESLEEAFHVIPTTGNQALEALKREAQRQRPARGGKGARDSVIWLSTIECGKSVAEVHFVSDNHADFGDSSDARQLHPDLSEECLASGVNLSYHRNLESILAKLSSKSLYAPPLASFERPPALAIVTDAVMDDRVNDHIFSELGIEAFIASIHVASATLIRSYEIGEDTLCFMVMQFLIEIDSRADEESAKNSLAVEAKIWLQARTSEDEITGVELDEIQKIGPVASPEN